jgi:hypothetical protein
MNENHPQPLLAPRGIEGRKEGILIFQILMSNSSFIVIEKGLNY